LDQKITHIPHGLDITRYPKVEINPEKHHLILAVGQLAERKGFSTLVEACRILKDKDIRFHCQIIGQGPQQEILSEMIINLAVEDCVSLCGALPHEDVIEHYANAKMLVMPCIQSNDGNLDGIPNVLFEAMSMGIPVISTHISAIPELVQDGENGILVFPGDSKALADAMETLINSPLEAIQLGKNGRDTILSEFDVETNVARFATTLWPQWFQ
jgi:glycosyltransferase involved in cell wall biosynthesis